MGAPVLLLDLPVLTSAITYSQRTSSTSKVLEQAPNLPTFVRDQSPLPLQTGYMIIKTIEIVTEENGYFPTGNGFNTFD